MNRRDFVDSIKDWFRAHVRHELAKKAMEDRDARFPEKFVATLKAELDAAERRIEEIITGGKEVAAAPPVSEAPPAADIQPAEGIGTEQVSAETSGGEPGVAPGTTSGTEAS